MSVSSSRLRATPPPVPAALLPIIAVVFIAFLVIGLALPVLPLHVHQDLGLGTFVVGLVAGAQFAASLLLTVLGRQLRRQSGRQARTRYRPAGRRGGRAALLPIARLRPRAGDIGHDPAPGPGGTRRGGELHRHRGIHLGIGARGATEYGPDYGLGRDGDVRRLCGRRAGRHQPVRRPRLSRRSRPQRR